MTEPQISWRIPVVARLQSGLIRSFAGPYEAQDFLRHEWPVRHGRHYRNAIRQCEAALNRICPAEIAREAFIAACIEANCLDNGIAANSEAAA